MLAAFALQALAVRRDLGLGQGLFPIDAEVRGLQVRLQAGQLTATGADGVEVQDQGDGLPGLDIVVIQAGLEAQGPQGQPGLDAGQGRSHLQPEALATADLETLTTADAIGIARGLPRHPRGRQTQVPGAQGGEGINEFGDNLAVAVRGRARAGLGFLQLLQDQVVAAGQFRGSF